MFLTQYSATFSFIYLFYVFDFSFLSYSTSGTIEKAINLPSSPDS